MNKIIKGALFSCMLVLLGAEKIDIPLQVALFTKSESIKDSKAVDVLLEIENTSARLITVVTSPSDHTLSCSLVDLHNGKLNVSPFGQEKVYFIIAYEIQEKDDNLPIMQGGKLEPQTEIKMDPHSVSYVKLRLNNQLLGRRASVTVEAIQDGKFIKSNSIMFHR